MNKTCEFCQYNGPYGSIINPCENCYILKNIED